MQKDINKMRKIYAKDTLSKADVKPEPLDQFNTWFKEVCDDDSHEANIMHLSTVSAEGKAEGRIVLLKDCTEDGFIFFTHYTSDKGQSIAANPNVALTFHWPSVERQVRIEGLASKVSTSVSDEYFYSRPLGSQIGAIASPQSEAIESYQTLEDNSAEIEKQDVITRPEEWGGYLVKPSSMEFWQGRPNRLHDRIKYTKTDKSWQIERLAP